MKVILKLEMADKAKLKKFVSEWNGLSKTLVKTQREVLTQLVTDIKKRVEDDTKPLDNPVPWQGHVYKGNLINSVKKTVKVSARELNSTVGYEIDYGANLEPRATVKGNVFVSTNIRKHDVDEDALYEWAVDMLHRRTTGDRFELEKAEVKAIRWADSIAKVIRSHGQPGYPIIIPLAEALFQGNDGLEYIDLICDSIKDTLKLHDEAEVPF